jgi:histidine triad (HIT) family protein
VYESDQVLAFLDIGPVSAGHCLIIPKIHADRLEQCDQSILAELGKSFGFIGRAVLLVTGMNDYNLLCNNGSAAGQIVPHVHFHIIPRKQKDGLFKAWPAGSYPEGEIDKMADRIRQAIDLGGSCTP